MALLSAEHLAGPGYIILNVLRGLNIIALASVVASSVVMLVKTFIISKFFFFDATSHVITAIAGLFFIVSECSLFRNFYARNWPLLSPSHGFVTLGCAMMIVGLNMLGNMNKEATSQESLTLPFWRLLVASGILAIVIGFFNIVASFVFRDKSRRITARMVRSRGAMTLHEDAETQSQYDPKHKAFTITTHHTGSTSSRSAFNNSPPPMRTGTPPVDCGSPQVPSPTKEDPNRLSQFDFSPLRAFRNARQSFLPSYHSQSPAKPSFFSHRPSSSIYSRTTSGEPARKKFWQRQREEQEEETARMPEISYPLNVNPQFAHLVKPNLAHHPSVRRPEADYEKF
ncbi:uncharacterized protein J4E87_003431 [Alternaria ethzedia]|uniref:uncharacterized protein n=1 Tax=Alternaria ethzedia TaxID=181014 RepID=UPI0020C1F258|nr:uncharacterized protein J4E87_003431 [Alternaria ethzedia]XP_049242309.1 uncharacterized protein J4E84_007425 [Alternaria hordeiaustralica]KAI4629170.1 hypothetical protein J4E87_003431 [Alternaria ethzedia]KAI4681829.1 hypothetical protein J4E84_007425 [Alternaria hordeiaustralica]